MTTAGRNIEIERPRPSFGSIEQRGGSLRAVYRLEGKKQTETFDTYAEAYDFLEEQGRAARQGGKVRNIQKSRTSWSGVAWAWYDLRHPGNDRRDRGVDYYAIRKFEATKDTSGREFGTYPIADISRQDIQRWINKVSEDPAVGCGDCEEAQIDAGDDSVRCEVHRKRSGKPLAPKSVHTYYQLIGQIMREAQLDGYLPDGCPIGKGLHKLPTVDRRMVFLRDEEVDRLLDTCLDDEFASSYAMVHLAAHTGLRQGEVLGLTRNRYNPIGKYLMVMQSAKKRTRTLGTTKTNRHRRIDLMPCCVEVVNAQLAAHEYDLVFPDRKGNIISADNWRNRTWDRLVEEAGFVDVNLHFHDLRHSHCTSLLAAGWDPVDVAARMGHASAKMTMDVYGHVIPGRQAQLLAKRGIRAVI